MLVIVGTDQGISLWTDASSSLPLAHAVFPTQCFGVALRNATAVKL